MWDLAFRFLTFNLGASVLAGLLMAAVVLAVTRLLGMTDARTRNSLYGLALLKSTLVLAGIVLVFPFPGTVWEHVQDRALSVGTTGPLLLLWVGAVLVGDWWLRAATLRAVERDQAAAPTSERIAASVQRVVAGIRRRDAIAYPPCCPGLRRLPEPRVVLTRSRGSPAVLVHGGQPVVLVPAALVALLDDRELDGVIAHELGHVLVVSEQGACPPAWTAVLRWSSPANLVLGRLLDREEELACDDIAAHVTGAPEALASALLKTYRFRHDRRGLGAVAASLLPERPLLEERVRRLANPDVRDRATSRWRTTLAWAVSGFFFVAFNL